MIEIQDAFIVDSSGIPFVARCYGGKYCMTHPGHELITGFLSAINSFGQEIYRDDLKMITFRGLSVVFDSDDNTIVALAVTADACTDVEALQKEVREIREKFYELYAEELKQAYNPSMVDGSKIIPWLDAKLGNPMGDLAEKLEVRKQGLLGRLKKRLLG